MKPLRTSGTLTLFLLLGTTIVPVYAQHEHEAEGKPAAQQARPPQAAPRPAQQPHAQAAPRPAPQQHAAAPRPQPQQQHARAAQPPPQQHATSAPQPRSQPQRARVTQPTPVKPTQSAPHQQVAHSQQARPSQPAAAARQQAVSWQQQKGWLHQGGGWQAHSTWQQGRTQNWAGDHRTWAQRGGYGGYNIPQATFNLSFGSRHWFRMQNVPSMYMGYPRFSDGGFSFLLLDPWPEAWAANWYDSDELYIVYNNGYYLYDRRYPSFGLAITVVL